MTNKMSNIDLSLRDIENNALTDSGTFSWMYYDYVQDESMNPKKNSCVNMLSCSTPANVINLFNSQDCKKPYYAQVNFPKYANPCYSSYESSGDICDTRYDYIGSPCKRFNKPGCGITNYSLYQNDDEEPKKPSIALPIVGGILLALAVGGIGYYVITQKKSGVIPSPT